MPQFKIITTKAQLPFSADWVEQPHSYCRGRNVDENGRLVSSTHQGRQYQIIHERVRQFSTLERVGRGFLGVLLVLGVLFSKSVRNLFTKDHEKIRFGILDEFPNQHAQGPITTDMVTQINIWKSKDTRVFSGDPLYDGDIIFSKDGKVMQTQNFEKAEVQALLRSFPDKIKILGKTDFNEKSGDPKLKGVKVLKYLRVVPGLARGWEDQR